MKFASYLVEQLGREPRIGDWVTTCCHEDLEQIVDADGLESIAILGDDYDYQIKIWPNKFAALCDIANSWIQSGHEPPWLSGEQ